MHYAKEEYVKKQKNSHQHYTKNSINLVNRTQQK